MREVFEGCNIGIDGHYFPVRLYSMGMAEFDIVLGMDWLANYNTNIVWKRKMIRIPLEDGSEVLVYGDRMERKSCLISMMRARRCLGKGCEGFIAYVIDVKKGGSGVNDVSSSKGVS